MIRKEFPVRYNEILERIETIDPVQYSQTRNFVNGSVTYLSPYISRGVISAKQVMEYVQAKGYALHDIYKLVQELAWREYFQRVWQHLEDDMFEDIFHKNTGIRNRQIPESIVHARTGIESIDKAITQLYSTGYMHNHLRMYTASIASNIGRSYWQLPSQWMYYHLLDGDLASNALSWQWVAGSFSARQYFCNQDNINKYTGSEQRHSFLDKSYFELPAMKVPEVLSATIRLHLETKLPARKIPILDHALPLVIYTSYNLDPLWKQDIKANRILLLEPSHFKQFPVSENVMNFILSLADNIEGLQVFAGEINEIPGWQKFPVIWSKEHPAFKHLPGKKEDRDWIFPEAKGFNNSFFSYWKHCEAWLKESERLSPQLIRA